MPNYKGFDKNLKCRDFAYTIGEEFSNPQGAKACSHGFHACEYPLDVFDYYAPADSRYCTVEQSGELSRKEGGDSKIASSKIMVVAEINIAGLVKAAIEYTMSRCKSIDLVSPASNSGYQGAASNSGVQGAAMNSGWHGKVMGVEGTALFLVHRDDEGNITHAKAAIVGKTKGVKAGAWYTLSSDGKFVEAE